MQVFLLDQFVPEGPELGKHGCGTHSVNTIPRKKYKGKDLKGARFSSEG